jgi:hypothetical protein
VTSRKQASAYYRDGTVHLHPMSQDASGMWIFSQPVIKVSEDDTSLGTKILEILTFSTSGVPHPQSWEVLNEEIKRSLKLRSFSKPTKLVGIFLEGGKLEFMPTQNIGRGRFLHLPDKAICCDETAAELTRFLRNAYAACT